MNDIDVWRAAQMLIKQHADEAEFVAAGRVDYMISLGDVAGEATWKLILKAICELRQTTPSPDENIH